MPAGNILVADDDAAIRTVLNQALSRAGYEVRSTSNAATLWRWVSQGEGDLVITDVIMPDENGLDLIPRIKKLRPELRVIVMSAQSTLLTAVKATERGAFEYLPKPFDLRELVSVVERALSAPRPAAAAPDDADDGQLPLIGRSPASGLRVSMRPRAVWSPRRGCRAETRAASSRRSSSQWCSFNVDRQSTSLYASIASSSACSPVSSHSSKRTIESPASVTSCSRSRM